MYRFALLACLSIIFSAGVPALSQDTDYASVLPGAVRFEAVENAPYVRGYNAAGERIGWVVISTDVTDTVGYSGQPMVTMVGLDQNGLISGVRVLEHHEPILLVGIPEQKLLDMVASYAGKPAVANFVVGRSRKQDAVQVDGISGATVTVLAQNQTIVQVARRLGAAVGILADDGVLPGHFVVKDEPWTFKKLLKEGLFGHLRVTDKEMGNPDSEALFIDLYFTIADAPQVGRALLAAGDYNWLMKNLKDGEHLLVVLANGRSSFKGSGFVRGGIFDRIRLEQKLRTLFFRDEDHHAISRIAAVDAPGFKEAAVFIIRDTGFDPGQPFELVFLGSRYDGKGGFSREFYEFSSRHRLPKSVYKLDVPDPESMVWRQAWRNKRFEALILILFFVAVIACFSARRWSTAKIGRLKKLHLSAMVFSLLVLGFAFGAQPSITQVLTFAGNMVQDFQWGLFLSEPLIFISWIFIAIVTFIWGRGVFCGWVCPYGALTEVVFKIGERLGVKPRELPDSIHRYLRLLRYPILVGLIVTFLFSYSWGERLAEIEPFKTTFFVPVWTRHWFLIGWWVFLLVLSVVVYRPFCRYLCPLGAGLAIPGSFRLSGPYRRVFCSSCKICTRGCEPRAIRDDGSIDPRECLSCMECEANFRDEKVCPPLIGMAKLPPLEQSTPQQKEKLARLHKEAMRV